MKDGEYVIFYLDLPIERYNAAARKYLKEKLFNTADYNVADAADPELLHGTSNWLNGFPMKKPFLMHQSATFDIAGRVSSKEAEMLYEFTDLSRRRLFPNPLPLFIMDDERERAFKIFKEDAQSGAEKRKAYLEVIGDLQKDHAGEVSNYYLIFSNFEDNKVKIRDFDYVSRFEYYLHSDQSTWRVHDLFSTDKELNLWTARYLFGILPIGFRSDFFGSYTFSYTFTFGVSGHLADSGFWVAGLRFCFTPVTCRADN